MRRIAQRQKRFCGFMFMIGLNETIDHLAIANSVCLYGHGMVMR